MRIFHRRQNSSEENIYKNAYDPAKEKPVLRCSICTGEQVAGFRDLATGHFEEVALISDDSDLEAFRTQYGITCDIEKVY